MDGLFIMLVLFGLYFLPSFVSYRNKNHGSVVVINLFLGWTVLGWVIALAMAMKQDD